MTSETTLADLKRERIVAIVRGVSSDQIDATASALWAGGIRCLEVAIDHAATDGVEEAMKSIHRLCDGRFPELRIGAGTVLRPEEVERAAAAGASYIISPNVDITVITRAKALGLASIPGAFTPTEAACAWEAGADIVKLFPAGLLGPGYLKALRGPFKTMPFMAVGGVDAENLGDFIRAGACGVGVGGNLVSLKAIAAGDFSTLAEIARSFHAAVVKLDATDRATGRDG